ncbi:hypothetical protein [Flammeovirga aprica]|uniref:T9SS type A sorting domain-containing protein n=1 Tax=Flammeovirga aprica JL-4 TaxID=694437 RepID=A0A7X9RUC1_9BACT|nr:hypothetical protein [Flammeovirga aprica]NME68844.1 hypothetical protein [Flammeovirga aprica JL-4]
MKSFFILFFCLLSLPFVSFSQATFHPNQTEYLSLEDWQNKENWVLISGTPENDWPTGDDTIETPPTRLNIEYLKINFNLNALSDQMTYIMRRQNTRLEIGENGEASFKIEILNSYAVALMVDGILSIKDDISFKGSKIILNVNGVLNIESDITFQNANNQLLINEGGKMDIGGNFNSFNGGGSAYTSNGELIIGADYTNNGKAILEIGEEGNARIRGNVSSNNGGGGSIIVYGVLYIENDIDLAGKETIYVDETGCLIIGGNVMLSCNNNINPTINGKLQFGSGTKCSISDGKCRENSPNFQICKKINEEDLPVELTKFYGVVESGRNIIHWETASEINNSHFEIQNSSDNNQWIILDSVSGAGNINTTIQYSYVDSISLKPFYRLKQVDFDGNSTFYGPINLQNNNGEISARLYPSVVTKGTSITLEIFGVQNKQSVRTFLISSSGQIIEETLLSVDIQGDFITSYIVPEVPSAGIYIFRVVTFNSTDEMKFYIY